MSNRSAYICDNVRTPIGRYGGALAQVRADDLAAHPIKTLLQRNTGLNPSNIDEVILGCANQAGEDNRNVARMATLLAGAPDSIPGMTVNRLCGSGMDAVGIAARAIKTGELDLVIAGGVESMSRAPFVMPKAPAAFTRENVVYDTTIGWRFINTQFQSIYGIDSMPETAENVAAGFAISRLDQDKFALRSQQKAQASIDAGRLGMEIEPISIPQSKGEPIIVARDEHPRATTLEKLQSLRTPFKASGTVTAGNASGVNDGACAMLVASKTAAEANQLTPMAKVVTMATSGLEPRIMGFGPYQASIKALKQAGLTANDLNIIELNEAFASQGLAVLRALGIDDDDARVNPNGGAIALGHPLGMSGARIVMSAARELQLSGGRYALCTMCVGVGQGIAIILEAA